jgi:hypothetical protein
MKYHFGRKNRCSCVLSNIRLTDDICCRILARDSPRIFSCITCKTVFRHKSSLTRHIKICDSCPTDDTIVVHVDDISIVNVYVLKVDEYRRCCKLYNLNNYTDFGFPSVVSCDLDMDDISCDVSCDLDMDDISSVPTVLNVNDNDISYSTASCIGDEISVCDIVPPVCLNRVLYMYVSDACSLSSVELVSRSECVRLKLHEYLNDTCSSFHRIRPVFHVLYDGVPFGLSVFILY